MSLQSNPAAGASTAIGVDGTSIFRLQMIANRIDLLENSQPTGTQQISLFSDIPLAIQRFEQRLVSNAAGAAIGTAVRLAIIVNISEEAPSAAQATSVLLPKLGLALPFQDANELIFQVNRPMLLKSIHGIGVNRLMKWQAENVQILTMTAGSGPIVNSTFLASLSVDINTVVPSRNFTPAEQVSIFQEIADEAKRLCQSNNLEALSTPPE